ncbi:FAD-binding protein [candidate division WOR-3 bacterium]|nr:FAD-binding protein [candidate division WOR-3 bacterium]
MDLKGGYTNEMWQSIEKVEATRKSRVEKLHPAMSLEEGDALLKKYHPDYKEGNTRELRVGSSKGTSVVQEVVDLLEAYPRIDPDKIDLTKTDLETDILVIGGGGAGASAAIIAAESGASVTIVTKLRLGDANTMMAQGGIQAADKENDSPAIHYLDVIGGGHFSNIPELVKALVMDAPGVIGWLEDLGVMFDKEKDGTMITLHGGGTSRKRMHSARDYTGGEIMKCLRDEVQNHPDSINILEFSPAVELLLDEDGKVSGAILFNLETEEYLVARATSVIFSTGGFGRLHIQGFPTTNHYGATADGLIMGYRAGVKLVFMDTVQYHPTGAAYPEQIVGQLVTEKIRGAGAEPVNVIGEQFVYPLEPRDIEAASLIRECATGKGVETPTGMKGVWLDTPLIEMKAGKGAIEKGFPAMFRQNMRFGINITETPILVYPTLHYQNGGLEISDDCSTTVPGLYVAGEVSGGVHGRNRLMGNSLLGVLVFGQRAGRAATEYIKGVTPGKLSLKHVKKYIEELRKIDIAEDKVAPMVLPDYTRKETKEKQLTTQYLGTLR